MSQPDSDRTDKFNVRDLRFIAKAISLDQHRRFANTDAVLNVFAGEEIDSFAKVYLELVQNTPLNQFKQLCEYTEDIFNVVAPTFNQYLRTAISENKLDLSNWDEVLTPFTAINHISSFKGTSRIIMAFVNLMDKSPDDFKTLLAADYIAIMLKIRDVLMKILKSGGYDCLTPEFFATFGFTNKTPTQDNVNYCEDNNSSGPAVEISYIKEQEIDGSSTPLKQLAATVVPPKFVNNVNSTHQRMNQQLLKYTDDDEHNIGVTTASFEMNTIETVPNVIKAEVVENEDGKAVQDDLDAFESKSSTDEPDLIVEHFVNGNVQQKSQVIEHETIIDQAHAEKPEEFGFSTDVISIHSHENSTSSGYDDDTNQLSHPETSTSDVDIININDVSITPLRPQLESSSTVESKDEYTDILSALIDDLVSGKFNADAITFVGKKMESNFVASFKDFEILITVLDKISIDEKFIRDAVIFLTQQVFIHLSSFNEGLFVFWKIVAAKENPLTKVLFDVKKDLAQLTLPGMDLYKVKNFAWLIVGDTSTTLKFVMQKALDAGPPYSKNDWPRLLIKVTAAGSFKWNKKSLMLNILQDVVKVGGRIDDCAYNNILKSFSATVPPILTGEELLTELMRHVTKPDSPIIWLNALSSWVTSLRDEKVTVKWTSNTAGYDNPAVTIGALVRLFCRSKPVIHNKETLSILNNLPKILEASDIVVTLRDELFYENSDWSFKFCAVEPIRDLIPRYHQEVPLSVYKVIPENKRSSYRAIRGDNEVNFEKYLRFVLEVLAIHDEIPEALVTNVYSVFNDVRDIHAKLVDAVYISMHEVTKSLDISLARNYMTNLLKLLPQDWGSSTTFIGVSKELFTDCQGLAILAGAVERGINDFSENNKRPFFTSLSEATQKLISLFSVLSLQLVKRDDRSSLLSLPWLYQSNTTSREYLEKNFIITFIRAYANGIHRRINHHHQILKTLIDNTSNYFKHNSVVHFKEFEDSNNYSPSPGRINEYSAGGSRSGNYFNGNDSSVNGCGYNHGRNGQGGGSYGSYNNQSNSHLGSGDGGYNRSRDSSYNRNKDGRNHGGYPSTRFQYSRGGGGNNIDGPRNGGGVMSHGSINTVPLGSAPRKSVNSNKSYSSNAFNDSNNSRSRSNGRNGGYVPRLEGHNRGNEGGYGANDTRYSQPNGNSGNF